MGDNLPPTPRQLRELRRLAEATGTTFTPPQTRRDASRTIAALRTRSRSTQTERQLERRDVSAALSEGTLASAPRNNEIHGYGSSARWAAGRRS